MKCASCYQDKNPLYQHPFDENSWICEGCWEIQRKVWSKPTIRELHGVEKLEGLLQWFNKK